MVNLQETDIPWLGSIPKHWDVKKMSHTTYIKARIGWQNLRTEEFIDEGPYCVTGTDFNNGKIEWDRCYHVAEDRYNLDPYIQLKKDDLLITKDGTIGKLALVDDLPDKATLNSGVFVTRPTSDDYDNRFMFWVLASEVFKGFITYNSTGTTINHLYQHMLNRFKYPLPPKEEQTAIADFLDKKTAQVDELISKKEQLLKLLDEQRTGLILNTVTKGLDQSVTMKKSGALWFNKVPSHWDVTTLRHLSRRYAGGTPSKDRSEYWKDGTIPWLNSGAVNQFTVTEPSAYITEEAYENSSAKWVPAGSLLMALAGQGKTKGMVAQTTFDTTCNQSMAALVWDNQHSRYMLYYLTSQYKNIRGLASVEARDGLNLEMIGNIVCPIPPYNEQIEITDYLDHETAKISAITDNVKKAITKLKEYRAALITNAVTGKIKVV